MLRLGIIPGPNDRARRSELADDGGASFFALCIGAWTAMFGALMASAPLIADRTFILIIGLLLIGAFPTAYYLYFSKVSRWAVNLTVLVLAVVSGAIELMILWPEEGVYAFYGLTASYRALVQAFLWVMAFRAFAVRGLGDLVLSVIPAISCVILAMVATPSPVAAVGAAMVIVGTLYLLAAEYRARSQHEGDAVGVVRQVVWERSPRRGAAVNTWQAIVVVVFLAAILAGAGASYMQTSSAVGRTLKEMLARRIAAYLIRERVDFSPDPLIWLTGDAPPDSSRIVFTVECDRGENWRQQSYKEYTGASWKIGRSRGRKTTRVDGEAIVDTSQVSGLRALNGQEVKQVYHMKSPLAISIPALFCPVRISGIRPTVSVSRSGDVHVAGYMRPGQTYEVTSLIPADGPTPRSDPLPPLDAEARQEYLQLPEDLPERVRAFARDITVDARPGDEYDAAMSVQNYLVANFPYDLQPVRRPRGADFVDHFLFEGRSGYCVHYATAMVVLCRTLGLPARLVTGFVPGELEPETDTYEVQAKDAHSWVEVYISGRGWQKFEPTPPFSEEEEEGLLASTWERLRELLDGTLLSGARFAEERKWPATWLVVALMSLLSAGLLQQRRRYGQVRLNGKAHSPNSRVRFAYAQMGRWLIRFGMPRRTSQPPLEYMSLLMADAPEIVGYAWSITNSYMRGRYSDTGVTKREAEATEEALLRLREALFKNRILNRER